jgi:hypothetical protein
LIIPRRFPPFHRSRMSNIRRLVAAELLIAGVLSCHEPTASDATGLAVPLRDRIVFESNRADTLGDVFVMKVDGTDPMALTDQTTADLCPALSPDGQWIAFYQKTVKDSTARFEIRNYSLILMKANGTEKRVLHEMSFRGWNRCPFWSANSDKIGVLDYLATAEAHTQTYYRFRVVRVDGSLLESFGRSGEVGSLSFTPAGDRFLAGLWSRSFGPFDFRASTLSFSGVESRLISNGFTPQWSSTAGKITYGCSGICLANPDGTGQVTIVPQNTASLPQFSPDGSLIAYSCSFNAGGWQLCFTTMDGKTAGPFVGFADAAARVWSPDSRSLAFTCGTGPEDICIIDRDGGNLRNLTQSPATYDRSPSFSPLTAH